MAVGGAGDWRIGVRSLESGVWSRTWSCKRGKVGKGQSGKFIGIISGAAADWLFSAISRYLVLFSAT
jgi:hypothetical protein